MGIDKTRRQIEVLPTPQLAAEKAASLFSEMANACVRRNGRFTVAMSGGSTPKLLYEVLAENYRERIPWQKTYLFWGDERYVAANHSDSNYLMTKEALLNKIDMPHDNVFPVPVQLSSAPEAAAAYEQMLKDFFGTADDQFPRFDLVLLGLGLDGHIASIFPGQAAVQEHSQMVLAEYIDAHKSFRITMTIPVINSAEAVCFLITGASKAPIVRKTLAEQFRFPEIPAQYVHPQNGRLIYVLDRGAGAELPASLLSQE